MTVYVDELADRLWEKGDSCHMWADTEEELFAFAKRIGLKREWIHRSRGASGEFPHFDLVKSKRDLAIEQGAVFRPLQDYIKERLNKTIWR